MENVEIERKFLVVDYRIIDDTSSSMGESLGTPIVQGYLDGSTSDRSVRVRVTADQATLTLKGPREGAIRIEYETGLPLEFGLQLLDFCGPRVVAKTRYPVVEDGRLWVIDVFQDQNEGLIIAEIEFDSPSEVLEKIPSWCGVEVTDDSRYYNEALADRPYSSW